MSTTPAPSPDRSTAAETAEHFFEQIGLRSVDVAALKRSGTITQETRGRSTVISKLRYRLAGRQIVKYLGIDQDFVRRVGEQLETLQAADRRCRRLRRLAAETRSVLREVRDRLRPALREAGFTFHGQVIRRSRSNDDRQEKTR
ncbi:MAG: hypothetical protein J0M17_27120 [Planctomycetes bacterium]|nr:hypothetical protein [Planctomycetota bacterium]